MVKSLRALLCLVGLLSSLSATVQAQSLSTGALSTSSVCQSGTVSVPFSATGPFGTGNIFTAQLSDASGSFTGTITPLGSITANPSSATTLTITAIIPASAVTGTQYKVQVVSSIGSKISISPTTLALGLAAPTVSVPLPYCANNATPPSTTATGSGLQWYNAAGNPIGNTVPVPTVAGSYTYSVSQSSGSCISPRTTFTITVNPKADGPLLLTLPYCVNTPPAALAVTGTSVQWFTTMAGTTGIPQPNPPAVTTTYYAQQTNANACKSDITPVTVTVYAQPAVPSVPPGVTLCAGTTGTLSATASPGNTLRWYGSNPQGPFTTAPPAVTASGTQYVSQISSNGCESTKAQIMVSVNTTPGAPAISTPDPLCSGQPVGPLSATASPGNTLRWYGDATTPTFSTTALTPSNLTSSTYYVAQADAGGCVGSRVGIAVMVNKRPAAPTLTAAQSQVNLCQGQPGQPLTASLSDGTSLNWYDNNGTTPLNGAPSPPTTATATLTYQVAQVLSGCEGPRATITATVNAIPAAPTVASVGPYCQGTAVMPLSATGSELRWYGKNSTGGTSTATQTPDVSTVGPATYYVTQTVKGCESGRGSVTVVIKPTPAAPGVTPVDFCQNTAAPVLTASAITNATLSWYGTNPTSTSLAVAPTPSPATPASLTYYVSQTLDGCEGPKALLPVRVKPTPGAPGTSPVAFCYNTPSKVLTAAGQNLTWFDQNDTPLNNAPAPATNAIGTQVFKVTQTVEGCVSAKSTVAVTVNPLPAAPTVANLQYCLPTMDQPQQAVGPLTAVGQNLKWYNPDGNQYTQTPVPPINQTNVINFQVTQTVNNCEGPKATLQVAVQTTPAPGIPKPLVTYCRNDMGMPLEATGTNLRWIDPNNTLLAPNTTPTPPTLNATKPGGVLYYVYQTGSNGCVSQRSSINVVVNTNPTLSLLGSNQVILGQPTSLQLRFTGAAPFSYTLSSGTSGTALGDTSLVVTPTQTTTYQVVRVANVCGNGLPGDPATATVTVKVPTITTGNLSSGTLCAGSTFIVPYTTQGDFNLTMGYQVQLVPTMDTSARKVVLLNPVPLTTNPVPVTIPGNTPGGTYYVRVVRTVATTPLIQVMGSNSPTLLTVRPMPMATLSGTQNLYEGSPTNLTVVFGGDSPWTVSYTDSIRTFIATATSNPYLLPVQPLRTTTYRLTSVSNNCGSGSVSGTAVVTVLPLLGVAEDPLSKAVSVYPTPTTARLTVAIDRPLYTEPALLEIVDLSGHTTLQRTTYTKQTDLDLSAHPAGIYVLKITLGDKQISRRILKQ